MPADTVVRAYTETTRLDIHDLVRRLNSHLGATLVAVLSNVRDSKLPYRWAKSDGPTPGEDAQERLRAAHRVWLLLADKESDSVARTWFAGANPLLDEDAPVMVLREGRIRDVFKAAEAFVEGTWSG